MPTVLDQALAALRSQGVLPRSLTGVQVGHLDRALQRYTHELAQDKLAEVLGEIKTRLTDVLNPRQVTREGVEGTVTEGLTHPSATSQLNVMLKEMAAPDLAERMDFMLEVAEKVSTGAGKFIQQNGDPQVVDFYPALELERFYDRDTPRGFRRGQGGALIPVPNEDWPSRWRAAADASGDTAAGRVLEETGRMVALKSSGIWQALGDGAGGYNDTLGNPFPPFAFNSGFNTSAVDRADTEDLGLLQPGETAKPAGFDLTKLFGMEAAA